MLIKSRVGFRQTRKASRPCLDRSTWGKVRRPAAAGASGLRSSQGGMETCSVGVGRPSSPLCSGGRRHYDSGSEELHLGAGAEGARGALCTLHV